jgi:hypothetical protein
MYGFNPEKIILDKIVYEVDSSDIPRYYTASFITLFVNWYNYRLTPLIRQFLLIPNKMNEFVNLSNVATPVSISSAGI